jgi:hypothetical protein
MKLSTLKPILLSLALTMILSIAGCTSMTGQSTGQYVDDRTITASVKSKLVAERASNLTRVDVDTTNHVVSSTVWSSRLIRNSGRKILPCR